MTGVGDRVKELRLQSGMSQTALAGEGVSPSYVSLIEAGKRLPTEDVLAKLAARLGTTTRFLLCGDDEDVTEQGRLQLAFARIALDNGSATEALDQLKAIDLDTVSRGVADDVLLATANAHERLGDLAASVQVLEPLIRDARERQAWVLVARAGNSLVLDYVESGDLSRACELGEDLLRALPPELQGTDEHIRLGSSLVWAHVERGDLLYAQQCASELIRTADQVGTTRARGSIYWNAAMVAQERGDIHQALTLTERALALLSEQADVRDLPRLRLHYAWLLVRGPEPDPEGALEALDLADAALSTVGSVIDRSGSLIERGRANLLLGQLDEAAASCARAIELLGDEPRLERTNALVLAGDVATARGRTAQAEQHYQRAADMLALMQAGRAAAAIWRDLGDRFLQSGDHRNAADAYAKALSDLGMGAARSPIPPKRRRPAPSPKLEASS